MPPTEAPDSGETAEVKKAKRWARALPILAPAIVTALIGGLSSYKAARDSVNAEVQVKAKKGQETTESVQQDAKRVTDNILARLLVIEKAMQVTQAQTEAAAKRTRQRRRPLPAPVAIPVKVNANAQPMAETADKAYQKVYARPPDAVTGASNTAPPRD